MPKGTPGALGALGNDVTCKIQATLLTCPGLSVLFYYTSLSILSYIAVKNDFDESKYKKLEVLIHIVCLGCPFTLAGVGLKNNYFNPAGPWCWVDSFPPGCEAIDGLDCIYQVDSFYRTIITVFTFGLILCMLLMMILIYCKIRSWEKGILNAAKEDGIELEFRRQKSKVVLLQLSLYFLSYFLAFIVIICARIQQWVRGSFDVSLVTAGFFFSPLQGFFNMIVYLFLRNSARNRGRFDYFVLRKFTEIDTRKAASDTESVQLENHTPQIYNFSIFEGTNPAGKWKDFTGEKESQTNRIVSTN